MSENNMNEKSSKNSSNNSSKNKTGKNTKSTRKSAKMIKQAKLLLKVPVVKDAFLGKGGKQKASYLRLPENFEEELLTLDVKNGAFMYEPIKESEMSNYTIIQARNLEMAYRAVVYKEAERAALVNSGETVEALGVVVGYNDADGDEASSDEDYDYDEFDFQFDIEDDFFEDDELDESETYHEHFSRIPLISMQSVENYMYGNPNPFGGFGNFGMEHNSRGNQELPWWIECTDESVCIVNDMTRGMMPVFGGMSEAISESALNALHRFDDNNHVYLLIISDKPCFEDFSISRAMLEFSANHYIVDCSNKDFEDYHHRLMMEIADDYGLKFSPKIDTVCLAKKLSSIDMKQPCATFEKVMNYITKKGVEGYVNPSVFEDFGLKKLIDKSDAISDKENEFDKLQGMDTVKNQLQSLLNGLRFNKKREEMGMPMLAFHKTIAFLGAPGTAKTTVAKALTKIMAKEDLIPGNRFIAISGAQLKGAYVGQTAPKVHQIFEEHDAIFIDEAYSLTSSNGGEIDMYAQEALAQIAVELEEHSNDKLVIFAGYGGKKVSDDNNKMKQFIESNPGIKSRISTTVYFDSYSPDDMVKIFKKLAEQSGLKVESGIDKKVEAYFFIRSTFEDYGNGREARVFLETCQQMLANRLMSSGKKITVNDMSVIKKCDVEAAIEYLGAMSSQQNMIKKAIGFA